MGLKRGPDGNLYYLTTTSASSRVDAIRRIRYDATNTAPLRNYFTIATPTLTWNRVTWAVAYEVQVANNAGFTGATIYPAGNNLAIILPAQNTGFYYWRVRACATTCSGGWSATDTFVVDVP